jgi:PKD repeat protein
MTMRKHSFYSVNTFPLPKLYRVLILVTICSLSSCIEDLPEAGSKPDNTPPTAEFSLGGGATHREITTSNLSTNATDYLWAFGDGETSTEFEPAHSYDADGTYTVTLTASDKNEVTSVMTLEVEINDETPPQADFSIQASPAQYKVITFTNLSVNTDVYDWDFGDGSTSTESTPVHEYATDGTYSVTLVASDNLGASSTITKEVEVVMPSDPTPPFADFTFNVVVGPIIDFVNASQNTVTYLWDFGDGATSTDVSPQHIYSNTTSTYTVTLTATDEVGATSTSIKNVGVVQFVAAINNSAFDNEPVLNDNRTAWRNTDLESSASATVGAGSWVLQTSSSASNNHTPGATLTYSGKLPFGTTETASSRWLYQVINVLPNTNYTIKAWIKQTSAKGSVTTMSIYNEPFNEYSAIGDPGRIVASQSYDETSGHATGTHVLATFSFNSGDRTQIVLFITNNWNVATGDTYLDDITIE